MKLLEQTMKSVRAGSSVPRASVSCVPSMLETKCVRTARVPERLQRFHGHDESEIGAADADVDDVRDRAARYRRGSRPKPWRRPAPARARARAARPA